MDLIVYFNVSFYVSFFHFISSTKSNSMYKIDKSNIFLVLMTIINPFFRAILFMPPH
jgi:hypothetical protein